MDTILTISPCFIFELDVYSFFLLYFLNGAAEVTWSGSGKNSGKLLNANNGTIELIRKHLKI